jgi:hypothetical protein
MARLNNFEKNEFKAQHAHRACGLVGYDIAFTRRRSPVRIRAGPFDFCIHSDKSVIEKCSEIAATAKGKPMNDTGRHLLYPTEQ